MAADPDVIDVAVALRVSMGLLVRRLRQIKAEDELTLPESSALARLDGGGPTTAGVLARLEQISPQSMGTTLGALEARGLVHRQPDPGDGRRAVISVTEAGRGLLRNRRDASAERLASALGAAFTRAELDQLLAAAPLIERLAQTV